MSTVTELLLVVGVQGTDGVVRELNKVENAQKKLGEGAAEVGEKGVNVFGDLGGMLSGLGGKMSGLGGPLGELGRTFSNVGSKVTEFGSGAEEAIASALGLDGAAAGTVVTLGALGAAAVAAVAAIGLLDKASEKAAEGAELLWQRQKFNALAMSEFGLTGEEMLGRLRVETRGLADNFKLMEVGTRLMQLGLVDNADQVAILTDGFVQMGWSVDQVSRAISNQSFDRIDNLMLNRGDLVAYYNDNLDRGMEKEAAYTDALIQAYLKQKAVIGDVGETAKGTWLALDAAKANFQSGWSEWYGNNMQWWGQLKTHVYEMLTPGLTEKQAVFWRPIHEAAEQSSNIVDIYGEVKDQLDALYLSGDIGKEKWVEGVQALNNQLDYTTQYGVSASSAMAMFQGTLANVRGEYEGWINYGPGMESIVDETIDYGAAALATINTRIAESYASRAEWLEQGYDVGKMIRGEVSNWDLNSEAIRGSVAEYIAQSMAIQDLGTNWKAMSKMAFDYQDISDNIVKNNNDMEQLEAIIAGTATHFNGVKMNANKAKEKLEELKKTGEELEGAFESLANKMTLDMLQATFGIGGYTEAEIQTMLGFMVESGMITRETADKMYNDYKGAVEKTNQLTLEKKMLEFGADYGDLLDDVDYVNGLFINKKTGEIDADITAFLDSLTEAERREIEPIIIKLLLDKQEVDNYTPPMNKKLLVSIQLDTSAIDGYNPPTRYGDVIYLPNKPQEKALGGPVWGGSPYLVGERGPELFIPSQAGAIVPDWKVNATANIDDERIANAVVAGMERVLEARDRRTQGSGYHRPLASAFENINAW